MSERLPIGATLGAFKIISFLAEGGMGAVYKASNRITGETRAVKTIRADLAARKDFASRFIREIRLASRIKHPNLVEVLEPAMDGDTMFLPMEFLEGGTLSAYLANHGRLSPREAVSIIEPVCGAVAALHSCKLVHRDLKPSNIVLARTADGRTIPKVLDLGAARDLDNDDELTQGAQAIGTEHYMALEQAQGRRDIDGRVDQYALAVIAYQMMTGKRPYERDDTSPMAKLLARAAFTPPRHLVSDIPAETEAVLMRALSHDRDARFESVREFATALVASVGAESATIWLDAGDVLPLESRVSITTGGERAPSASEIRTYTEVSASTMKPLTSKRGSVPAGVARGPAVIVGVVAGLAIAVGAAVMSRGVGRRPAAHDAIARTAVAIGTPPAVPAAEPPALGPVVSAHADASAPIVLPALPPDAAGHSRAVVSERRIGSHPVPTHRVVHREPVPPPDRAPVVRRTRPGCIRGLDPGCDE